jgi:hypothetical protein
MNASSLKKNTRPAAGHFSFLLVVFFYFVVEGATGAAAGGGGDGIVGAGAVRV